MTYIKPRVIIVGAGGHAQVVADILLRCQDMGNDLTVRGFVDDNSALTGQSILDLPVLGRISDLDEISHDALVIAVGANETRFRIFERLKTQGEDFISAIHPRATIAPDVVIGKGVTVCAGAVINTGAIIGANTIINTASSVDHHSQIGSHCHVAPGAHLGGAVAVEEMALIGIGATVMPQCRIGKGAIVGAGALVTRDIPPYHVVTGVPARP